MERRPAYLFQNAINYIFHNVNLTCKSVVSLVRKKKKRLTKLVNLRSARPNGNSKATITSRTGFANETDVILGSCFYFCWVASDPFSLQNDDK